MAIATMVRVHADLGAKLGPDIETQIRRWSTVLFVRSQAGSLVLAQFQHALAAGPIGQLLGWAKPDWGHLLAVAPYWVKGDRCIHVLSLDNPVALRFACRNEYKLAVGADLVNDALAETLSLFRKRISTERASILSQRLRLTPSEFWRNVRRGHVDHCRSIMWPDRRRALWARRGRYMLPFSGPVQTMLPLHEET